MSDPSPAAQHKQRQRLDGLRRANQQRKVIGAMRAALKTGALDGLELLRGNADPKYEAVIAKWPIRRVLPMLPGVGDARTYQVLTWGHVSPNKQVRDLSYEKRAELARLVEDARKEIRVDLI